MRKGRDGEKKKKGEKKTNENSGHYNIASSRPPERRTLERRTLAPIKLYIREAFIIIYGNILVIYKLDKGLEISVCTSTILASLTSTLFLIAAAYEAIES